MAADPARTELAQLRELVHAQQGQLAAQQARLARLEGRRARPRRLVPLALVALLVALVPLATLAAGPFQDLNANSPHNANIQAIADAGITRGCDPPAFVTYCPSGLVTREEMASFLARTAGLGGNPPVANALTAVSAQSAGSATSATNAGNAATVGGLAPSELVRTAMAIRSSDTTLPATAAPLLTLTIVAPAAGFLHITSTMVASNGSGQTCAAYHYLRDDRNTGPTYAAQTYHPPVAPSLTGAQTYVFAVSPGTRVVTMYARATQLSTGTACAGNVVANEATITALFVPFGHDGGTTLAP